jgi:hypothetical protein
MPTTEPTAAMHEALAAHIKARLVATPGLAQSDCLTYFPASTETLELHDTRVVVAVERVGEPKKTRLGGPRFHRAVEFDGGGVDYETAKVRYDYDVVEQDFAVVLEAPTQTMRDEASEVLFKALNLPYWSTCPPSVTDTLLAAIEVDARGKAIGPYGATIPKAGRFFFVLTDPTSLGKIWPGTRLMFDDATAAARELVVVDKVDTFGVYATFTKAHGALAPVVEVVGRRNNAESGLSLRCPLHFGTVARFRFGEGKSLDDAEGGRSAARQQWRSIREGSGSVRHLREIDGVVLRDATTLREVSGATPKSTVVF